MTLSLWPNPSTVLANIIISSHHDLDTHTPLGLIHPIEDDAMLEKGLA